MSTKLEFSVRIQATRPHVWRAMLDDPTYRVWTRPFCAGSYYEGSWDEGARIRIDRLTLDQGRLGYDDVAQKTSLRLELSTLDGAAADVAASAARR